MSASPPEGVRRVVLGADVRVRADVLAALFERDRQLAVALNTAQRRLLAANERLTVAMPVAAVSSAVLGLGGADLGLTGRRPPVLEAESGAPVDLVVKVIVGAR